MNLQHWSAFLHGTWHAHPDLTRLSGALLAYVLMVSLMAAAAALISAEMPFFDTMPSI